MASAAQNVNYDGPSRRRVPRFRMHVPVDVTVLRSGSFETLPGRAFNVCEGGIGAMVAGELRTGESAAVEIQLSDVCEPLCTRVTVRYQDRLRCGLEFAAISADQRAIIRNLSMEPGKAGAQSTKKDHPENHDQEKGLPGKDGPGAHQIPRKRIGRAAWLIAAMVIVLAAAVFWWRWNHGWEELESGLRTSESSLNDKPQAQVPAEVMQKLLLHRVEAVYPPDARKQNLQGVVALDIVVGRDGSVLSMRPLNGPEMLARAAMDALRWWRFEPYRINGEPAVVETTMAVEFKR